MNYGDGSGDQPLSVDDHKQLSLSHIYDDAGVYTVTVTVEDDDGDSGTDTLDVTVVEATAAVSVSSSDRYATEPGDAFAAATDTAVFVISRTGDTTYPLPVDFSLSGSALYGTNGPATDGDYTLDAGSLSSVFMAPDGTSGVVEIRAGQSSVTLLVIPEYDTDEERVEQATLEIDPSARYTIDGTRAAKTIAIMDPGIVHIPANDDLVIAGNSCGSDGSGNHNVCFCIPGMGCFGYMSDANPHPTVGCQRLDPAPERLCQFVHCQSRVESGRHHEDRLLQCLGHYGDGSLLPGRSGRCFQPGYGAS